MSTRASPPSSPLPPGVRASFAPEAAEDVDVDSAVESMIAEVTDGLILSEPPPPLPKVAGDPDAEELPSARHGEVLAQRYVLQRLVAKGGMGKVYIAIQQPLGREVAVKCLIPRANDREFRKRFFLEASTCARLTHRHIVTVHDYGETEGGELFMAMEYLRGEPLSRVLAREGRLDSERVARIALQVSRALRAAHRIGVVHRDLKPANVMLLRDEDQEVADFIKVLDFGLVKAFQVIDGVPSPDRDGGDLTRAGTWLGSPRYMAPEQIRCRDVDPRTDIYSLGAITFHMLAGRPPFMGATSVEIFGQHLRDPVPWIGDLGGAPDVAPELEVVVRRCMEKEPDARYASMDEVIADLEAALRVIGGLGAVGDSTSGGALETIAASWVPARSSLSGMSRGPAPRAIEPSHLSLDRLAEETFGPDEAQPALAEELLPEPLPIPSAIAPAISSAIAPAPAALAPPAPAPRAPTPRARPVSAVPSVPPMRARPILPAALAVLLGLGLLYFVFGRGEDAARTVEGPSASSAARPAVKVSLASQPVGAEVSLDGVVLGRTPLEYVARDRPVGAKLRFEFALDGHVRRAVEAELRGASLSLTAALEPLPVDSPRGR